LVYSHFALAATFSFSVGAMPGPQSGIQ